MKLLLAATFALFTSMAFAEGDVTEMKQKMNDHLDKKITRLNTAKGCVNEATTADALKACRKSLHADMKMMKEEKKKMLQSKKKK